MIYPATPTSTEFIPPSNSDLKYLFESMSAIGDNYGSYSPGYIEPPETGDYTFWVCGDDEVQLWLTDGCGGSIESGQETENRDGAGDGMEQRAGLCQVSGATIGPGIPGKGQAILF